MSTSYHRSQEQELEALTASRLLPDIFVADDGAADGGKGEDANTDRQHLPSWDQQEVNDHGF